MYTCHHGLDGDPGNLGRGAPPPASPQSPSSPSTRLCLLRDLRDLGLGPRLPPSSTIWGTCIRGNDYTENDDPYGEWIWRIYDDHDHDFVDDHLQCSDLTLFIGS
eukprot:1194937-Prorocentrum_minimum.AAC.5